MRRISSTSRYLARLISLSLLAVFSASAFSQELKLAHFMPPKHSMHAKVFAPLAEKIEQASQGDLKIRIYPSGTLGKGPVKQFKRATDGTADILFGVHSYTPKLFPKSMLSVQVGSATDATDATQRIWNIYDDYLTQEYRRVKTLGLWTVSPVVIISRTKPVHSMADLKGMKVTSSGSFIAPLLQAWGAVPVPMKLPEIYNALATGVVDAVAIAPSAIYKPWNFGEVAKYVTTGVPGTLNPLFLVMNKKKWQKLPQNHKDLLHSVTGRDFSIAAAKVFQAEDESALSKAQQDNKLTVIPLSDSAQKELHEAGKKVLTSHFSKLEAKGVKDISAAYQAFNN